MCGERERFNTLGIPPCVGERCTLLGYLRGWERERCTLLGIPPWVEKGESVIHLGIPPWVEKGECYTPGYPSSRGWERGLFNSVIPAPVGGREEIKDRKPGTERGVAQGGTELSTPRFTVGQKNRPPLLSPVSLLVVHP